MSDSLKQADYQAAYDEIKDKPNSYYGYIDHEIVLSALHIAASPDIASVELDEAIKWFEDNRVNISFGKHDIAVLKAAKAQRAQPAITDEKHSEEINKYKNILKEVWRQYDEYKLNCSSPEAIERAAMAFSKLFSNGERDNYILMKSALSAAWGSK